ncbi:MAG: hypothetical protein IIX13_06170 [Bacteroidales bacterium]|nr:hypothetical protein [Bacteroidales bacterium]
MNNENAIIRKIRNCQIISIKWNDYKTLYQINTKAIENYILTQLRGMYFNKDSGHRIHITRKSVKVLHHDVENEIHLKSIVLIPTMIENAIFIGEMCNEKAKHKFDSFRYYIIGIQIDNIDYTVKLVAGVKGQECYYDHSLTQIQKNDLIDQMDLVNAQVYDHKIVYSASKDKRLLSILQKIFKNTHAEKNTNALAKPSKSSSHTKAF